MSSRLKSWLLLVVIFIAGVLAGGALAVGLGPHFDRPPGPQQIRAHWMAHLKDRLNLTPEQETKIEPILGDAETKIRALHRNEVDSGSQIMKAANDQIATLLTDEQKTKLQAMEAEREKMFSSHVRRWGPPPPDDPHGDGNAGAPPPHPPSGPPGPATPPSS